MSRVSTNTVGLRYIHEDSLGVPGVDNEWKKLEPNDISTFGATISTVARNPISSERQRKKGTVTDLDSAVEFDADMTMGHALDFLEGFVFAVWAGAPVYGEHETEQVTATSTSAYTVTNNASNPALDEFVLVYGRGFTNSANNGLHVVDAGATTTSVAVKETLVAEASPPTAARLEVCGIQAASGDLTVAITSGVTTIVSAGGLDWTDTDYDLKVGQMVWVGGDTAVTQFVDNTVNRGWGRIIAITSTVLSIDNTTTTFATDAGTSKTVQIFFGRFLRNVSTSDADYLERSYTFEAEYPDLDSVGTPEYEYAKGNFCNQVAFNLPLADKATGTFGFIGTDTEVPVTTRKVGATAVVVAGGGTGYSVNDVITLTGGTFSAATTLIVTAETGGVIDAGGVDILTAGTYTVVPGNPVAQGSVAPSGGASATFTMTYGANTLEPLQTTALNTSSDIARIRFTDTSENIITTYFKSLTFTINNNVTPEKALGTLGAVFVNTGNFEIDIEAQLIFTDSDVITAIRNNQTLMMQFSLRNDDGTLFFDVPAMTIGGGDKEYPENESVLINTPGQAVEDATLGTSIGISHFPFTPSS